MLEQLERTLRRDILRSQTDRSTQKGQFASIAKAIEDYRNGKIVIIMDDEHRENEGDLCIAAEYCDSQAINFMATHGRGLICTPMLGERLDELNIPLMVSENSSGFGTAFTVSVEAKRGVYTGISASDRATTVQTLIDPTMQPGDIARPGHMFPLRYAEGGVLRRPGQTEASIDLAKLAGLYPAAVICEIMRDDGEMARLPDIMVFAARHDLSVITVQQLIDYRLRYETQVEQVVGAVRMPTRYGDFQAYTYETVLDGKQHVAMVKGESINRDSSQVLVHRECLEGNVLGGLRCDCGAQWEQGLRYLTVTGRGLAVYLRGTTDKTPRLHEPAHAGSTLLSIETLRQPDSREAPALTSHEFAVVSQILADLERQPA